MSEKYVQISAAFDLKEAGAKRVSIKDPQNYFANRMRGKIQDFFSGRILSVTAHEPTTMPSNSGTKDYFQIWDIHPQEQTDIHFILNGLDDPRQKDNFDKLFKRNW
jgi:hypothetical protein